MQLKYTANNARFETELCYARFARLMNRAARERTKPVADIYANVPTSSGSMHNWSPFAMEKIEIKATKTAS